MQQFVSERFKFYVENYQADLPGLGLMKHIRIYCQGAKGDGTPLRIDLWLAEKDIDVLREAIDYSEIKSTRRK